MIEFQEAIYEKYLKYVSPYNQIGKAFTSLGPSPYIGNILEHNDLLWTEDIWTLEKEDMAKHKLKEQDAITLSLYWKNNYIIKANNYWHKFYQRNSTHFYKDRHYIHIIFPELLNNNEKIQDNKNMITLLEVGCGVGNAIIPLIDLNPNLHIVAIDFAKSAIDILNQHQYTYATTLYGTNQIIPISQLNIIDENKLSNIVYIKNSNNNIDKNIDTTINNNQNKKRIRTALCDIVKDQLPVESNTMNLILCMFVLSAISPEQQYLALKQLSNVLIPGGKLLIRDYGKYDEAQLRFKKGSKISEDFYVRQDGTCSYFFTLEQLEYLGKQVGLQVEESYYIRRQYANRQQKQARHRIWIHIKFMKLL